MKYRNLYCSPKYSDGDKTYYGSVEGVPEISLIEAGSLEDFERLFKQAVDDYLDNKPSHKRLGGVIGILAVLLVAGIAVVTCPGKQAHKDAILAVINETLNEGLKSTLEDEEGGATLALWGATVGTSMTGWFLNENFSVENRFVYSVGKFNAGDGPRKVSVGLFGHVFTFSKADLERELEKTFGE